MESEEEKGVIYGGDSILLPPDLDNPALLRDPHLPPKQRLEAEKRVKQKNRLLRRRARREERRQRRRRKQ